MLLKEKNGVRCVSASNMWNVPSFQQEVHLFISLQDRLYIESICDCSDKPLYLSFGAFYVLIHFTTVADCAILATIYFPDGSTCCYYPYEDDYIYA